MLRRLVIASLPTLRVFTLIALQFGLFTQVTTTEVGYVIQQSVKLSQAQDGFEGRLDLLVDEVLISKVALAPKVALLQLVSSHNQVLQKLLLEKPIAEIKTADFSDIGNRLILVTQDFSADFGSYSGPISKILEISNDTLHWAEAWSAQNKSTKISLLRSLKTAWSFAPSKNGKSKDILKVSCRFDPGSEGEFKTVFSRFHREKTGWQVTERSKPILWERENDSSALPNLKEFP